MLQINGLSKSFGPQALFSQVTLQLNVGSRYGLVGANGAGKTTFLRILTGDDSASEGEFSLPKQARVGVLRQDRFMADDQAIIELAMMGEPEVYAALKEQEQLAEGQRQVDAERLAALQELIGARNGYSLKSRASSVLVGLGIPSHALDQPLSTLSGGFKLRVLLAQVLVGDPEVLLLDEPTNHLDILSIRWLEDFLRMYAGCAVIISHDFMFLNRVATHILDVDYGTILPYVGNYDDFVRQKQATRDQKEAEIARQKKIVADKLAFIERFRSKATKARQAQSRVKQVEKISIEELPETSRRQPRFRFEPARPSGRDVLSVEALSKSFGEKQVLRDVSLLVRRGERVAVIGANGLGKSTLIKIFAGRLEATSGKVQWGHEARIGYFAQDHKDLLENPRITPLSFIWDLVPEEGTAYVRGQLGRVLFNADDVEKSVTSLSGGEAARLIFCQIGVQKPNVLLLDEPTNHLDLEAIEALADALLAYEGTLLFVSHDRWFVSKLATRVVELRADGMTDFAGTYEEYLAKSGEDHLDESAVVLKARREKAASKSNQAELSYQDRKRLQNRLKTLPKKRDEVLEEISSLEVRVAEIQASYASPQLYDSQPGGPPGQEATELLGRLRNEERAAGERIAELTAEWETLENELLELESLQL